MKCEKELALLREDIRKGRKNKKITQEELAEKLEVSPTQVKHIESGCIFTPILNHVSFSASNSTDIPCVR